MPATSGNLIPATVNRLRIRPEPASAACSSGNGSPELAAAQQDVQDRADAPEEADDDPQHLGDAAHVPPVDDVDDGQDERNGVEEDREQDLDEELHQNATSTRGQPPAGAYSPSASWWYFSLIPPAATSATASRNRSTSASVL